MQISLNLPANGLTAEQAKAMLGEVIRDEAQQAKARMVYFAAVCRALESAHKMTSDEFLVRFERGELGDDQYLFDWFAAKEGLDYWSQRHQLLDKVTL